MSLTEPRLMMLVSYVMIVIAGVFLWQAALAWLTNQRERRIHQIELADMRRYDGFAAEREAWQAACDKKDAVIVKKDELIADLNEEIISLARDYDRAQRIMSETPVKGRVLVGTKAHGEDSINTLCANDTARGV